MKTLKSIIKILFALLFVFLARETFSNDWIPKVEFINQQSERALLLKIINKQTITYCVDEEYANTPAGIDTPSSTVIVSNGGIKMPYIDSSNYRFEIEYSLKRWFKNVLRRSKQYPNFNQEFKDILDILKTPVDIKEIKCGPHPKEYSFPNFKTQDKKFVPGEEIEDLRVVFSSKETMLRFPQEKEFDPNTAGFYYPLSDRKLIWVSKQDALTKRYILIHEFGHLLGLADVSYDEEHQAKEYGNDSQKTIMAKGYTSLSCDDADGLIALIYLALERDKTFRSFCNSNVFYENGKKSTKEEIALKGIKKKDIEYLFKLYNLPLTINFE